VLLQCASARGADDSFADSDGDWGLDIPSFAFGPRWLQVTFPDLSCRSSFRVPIQLMYVPDEPFVLYAQDMQVDLWLRGRLLQRRPGYRYFATYIYSDCWDIAWQPCALRRYRPRYPITTALGICRLHASRLAPC